MKSQLIEKIFEEPHPIGLTIEKERKFLHKIILDEYLFPIHKMWFKFFENKQL